MTRLRIYFALLAVSLGLFVPGYSDASIIIADTIKITDVTPVHFSVVWATSEPATCSLDVFLDSEGKNPYTGASVASDSAKHPPAENIGVMKVQVVGLKPATSYFIRIRSVSKNDSSTHLYPTNPPFIEVKTEEFSSVVRNDVFAQQIGTAEGRSAEGTLVIAELDQASHPVTAWAGHGIPDGWAAIDMNNFYDKITHSNLELPAEGGEPVTLTLFCGSLGAVEVKETVPAETGSIQAGSVVVQMPDSGNDSPPPASSTGSSEGGGGGGGGCFIASVLDDLW